MKIMENNPDISHVCIGNWNVQGLLNIQWLLSCDFFFPRNLKFTRLENDPSLSINHRGVRIFYANHVLAWHDLHK